MYKITCNGCDRWGQSFIFQCAWKLFSSKDANDFYFLSKAEWKNDLVNDDGKNLTKREYRPGYTFVKLETTLLMYVSRSEMRRRLANARGYLRKWFVSLARLTRSYYEIFFRSSINMISTLNIYFTREKILLIPR